MSALHPVSEGLSPSPAASLSLFLSQNHLSLEPGPCLNPPKLFVLHSAPSCFIPALPQDGASPRSGANSFPLPLHWLHPHRHPISCSLPVCITPLSAGNPPGPPWAGSSPARLGTASSQLGTARLKNQQLESRDG